MKRNKTKTQHNLEKLATQSTQDEEKQNKNTTQPRETGKNRVHKRNWKRNKTKTQHNLEKLATQSTQDEEKTKTQHNLEKLATQSTQDEEKQNKNTTQPRETGNIEYTR